jgi:glycosyltransferase involved in cell wall biosynthesis
MRIVYLAPNIPVPGTHGGSTHTTLVYRELSKRHDVLLFCRHGSTEKNVLAYGFAVAPILQKALIPYSFARVYGAVKSFRPDVIYERYSAFGLGPLLGKALHVPSVLMTLDRDASDLSFHHSARIVATSHEFIPEQYRHKLRIVHWGVDIDHLTGQSPDPIRARHAPHGERIVLYTGSFPYWHGADILVSVAKEWSGPPVVFLMVGDGQDKSRVERMAESAGTRQNWCLHRRRRRVCCSIRTITAPDLSGTRHEPRSDQGAGIHGPGKSGHHDRYTTYARTFSRGRRHFVVPGREP